MAVTGAAELIANLQKLDKRVEKKTRHATRDGADVFRKVLKENTPVAKYGDHSNMTPLAEHTAKGNLKATGGDYSVDVGYDKEKGWIVHFPDAGTSKQRPQHFVEKSRDLAKEQVLAKFVEDLQL